MNTRVAAIEDKTSTGSGTTDESRSDIMWPYIQTFNSLLNKGGLGNQIDGAAEEALQEILDMAEDD